ncbi:MAG: hypothetical protein IT584_01690 [Chlamydiae bacterium]|nr:hypothetical protein [Chlamydiota bacterium]
MNPSPSSSTPKSWTSCLWNSLPRRAIQSGLFSGTLAAGETLLICTYTPNFAIDAVQYLATGILISSALIVCHSLGDKNTSYSDALKEPLVQGRVIWLKAQGFLNSNRSPSASSSSSSEPIAESSSRGASAPEVSPSLSKIPKEVTKVVFQTLKGTTRALEFFGAREEAVAVGLALGGTTYLLLEDGQTSTLVAGGSAGIAGIVFFPTPLLSESSGGPSAQNMIADAEANPIAEEKKKEE